MSSPPRWRRCASSVRPETTVSRDVTTTDDDEALLTRYLDAGLPRGAREAAFSALVDRYHRRVFAVCLPVLGSVTDAEDATQETFLKLARNAGSFRGDARLSTWLYRVARNVCIDHVRHDSRRPTTPVPDIGDLDHAPVEPDGSGATETAVTIAGALAELDPLSRRLLVLVAVEGLTYDEAAAATDLATGTVKSRVSRARAQLARTLATGASGDAPGTDPQAEGTAADRRSSHP